MFNMFAAAVCLFAVLSSLVGHSQATSVSWYSTTRDGKFSLTEQTPIEFTEENAKSTSSDVFSISIDESIQYQKMYGIGNSLEASTCYNLMRMSAEDRSETLAKILDPEEGIGMSLMRVTVGTSDFCPLPFYSYDDLPAGQTDPSLKYFSVERDQEFILPVLREAAEKYAAGAESGEDADGLRFFASTWSAPAWMKEGEKLEGGRFNTEHFGSYSDYLVRFIEAYAAEGVRISALTPQNEPLQNEETYPTTLLLPGEEAELIRDHLGPALRNATGGAADTKIWCFDHNFNTLFYPKEVLSDPEAAPYVDGAAFHNYGGRPSAMTELHDQFPDKRMVFSEGSTFGVRGGAQIVEILRNWASTYNAWVSMLDSELQPNAGPFRPSPTMIEMNAETLKPTFRYEYYLYGQFSKFIRRGAVRVESTAPEEEEGEDEYIAHVAFVNPSDALGGNADARVLVVVSLATEPRTVQLRWKGQTAEVTLPAASVSTFRWKQ